MKNQTSRLRHEPPCDRVAFFVTFQNLRKPQGRSERLETTYPLAFKSIGAGKPIQAIPSATAQEQVVASMLERFSVVAPGPDLAVKNPAEGSD